MTAGLVANPDGFDAPFTAVTGSAVNIDVLANDFSPLGTPTIVELTQGSDGFASLNADNTVAYTAYSTSFPAAALFGYTISDGVSYASAWVYVDVIPSASDLYAKYQADVSAADQVYTGAVLDAAAIRRTDIDAARATAEFDAAQLYADYQLAVTQATQTYEAAVAAAEAVYQSAVASADTTHQTDTDAALVIYDAALATSQTVYDDAVIAAEAAYQADLLAADAAYDAAIAPYQAALAQAIVDADSAQVFFASADAALSATMVSATAERDASQSAALVAYAAAPEQSEQAHLAALELAAWLYDGAMFSSYIAYAATVDPVQAARDQADAAYLADPTQAALFDLWSAEAALASAIAQATSDRDADQAAALVAYQASVANADETLANAPALAAQVYQDALTAADVSYAATVAPYQTARDDADAANQSAQAALTMAVAGLSDAMVSATSGREEAIVAAVTAREVALAAAVQDRDAAHVSALAAYDGAYLAADQAWTTADDAAWNGYLSSTTDVYNAYVVAEETAWNLYVNAAADVRSAFAATHAGYQSEFADRTNLAAANWSQSEQIAWDSYLAGLANLPVPSASEARSLVPPTVAVAPPPSVLPPAVQANSFEVLKDQDFSTVFATFTAFANPIGTFTAAIDFGDGQTATATVDGFDVVGAHVYATAGTYTFTVTVTDTLGATASATGAITVLPHYDYTYTDPVGNETHFIYSGNWELRQEIDPLGNSTYYTYAASGQLATRTDRLGRKIEYAYDADGRLTSETWLATDGATVVDTLAFTYSTAGELLSASNAFGAYTFNWTDGQLASVINPFNVTLTFGYDADGHRTSVADSFGGMTTSVYTDGLLASRQFSDGAAQNLRVDLGYNAAGWLTGIARFSDLAATELVATTQYAFVDWQLASITHRDSANAIIDFFNYEFDANNLLTSIDSGSAGDTDYAYDATGQVVSETSQLVTQAFSFDANGNRVSSGYVIGVGNRLLSDGVWNYTYDAEGNTIGKVNIATGKSWSYAYDHRNHMTHAEQRAADGTLVMAADYRYDAFSNRIEKTVATGGSPVVTRYVLDGFNPDKLAQFGNENFDVWAEMDGNGSLTTRYLHGDEFDQVFARIDDSETRWLLTDQLQSVRAVIDNAGTVLDRIAYDAFGNITYQLDPSLGNHILFTSREFDRETGLYYSRARYLNAQTGTWTTLDPMGFAAGDPNLYRYVGNSPTNATDPSGLEWNWRWRDVGNFLLAEVEVGMMLTGRPVSPVAFRQVAGGYLAQAQEFFGQRLTVLAETAPSNGNMFQWALAVGVRDARDGIAGVYDLATNLPERADTFQEAVRTDPHGMAGRGIFFVSLAVATQKLMGLTAPVTGGQRLVVGGGRGTGFPQLAEGDVSLNISQGARPHVVGDIRTVNPSTLGRFNEVFFERVPFDAITPQAIRNSAAVLQPGGRISIVTGRLVDRAALRTWLEQAGFRNVEVLEVGTGNAAHVTATGTLGGG